MVMSMPAVTASQARAKLFPLLEQVATEGPIQVVGRKRTAVLVSQDEWDAMVETLQIIAQPKLLAKIKASERVKRGTLKTLAQIK